MPEYRFAEVIIPLAVGHTYTYEIPHTLEDKLKAGMRVEVPFGKRKTYSGIIMELHNRQPVGFRPKAVIDCIDEKEILNPKQFTFWNWLSEYYHCYLGEVMLAALPAGLKLQSETIISKGKTELRVDQLDDKEYLIMEALEHRDKLTIKDVQGILQQKTVYPIIRQMIDARLIEVQEEIKDEYREKEITILELAEDLSTDADRLKEVFDDLRKYEKQEHALLAFLYHIKQQRHITKSFLVNKAEASASSIRTLIRKGILTENKITISRISRGPEEVEALPALSVHQKQALDEIREIWKAGKVTLLHGVTGSGKTRIYIECMMEALESNEQVLYLLPEIALTNHFIERLQSVFGSKVIAYHSRISNAERIEIWHKAKDEAVIIIGPRSTIFLPFSRLGLIIVDESHDGSFKQQDPAPRYHGRDAAVVLGQLFDAKVILGTATPSVESEFNARTNKFGKVRLTQRFGDLEMPEIRLVNMTDKQAGKLVYDTYSKPLIDAINKCIAEKKQVILFRNRRGYTPHIHCRSCGWHAMCINCDIGLTYHKYKDNLHCHLCGYQTDMIDACPSCGNTQLSLRGVGTEKIEEHLGMLFEGAKIARLDQDTARSKKGLKNLMHRFDDGDIDILVGTQMITKGLDFDNVGLVGILNADAMLYYPDFRATERAFQLMTQVAGRAGRKEANAQVIIQAYALNHPVFQEVLDQHFEAFFARELGERKKFMFPPYVRLIHITLKHKDRQILEGAADFFYKILHPKLGNRFKGPIVPPIERIKNQYLKDFVVKIDKTSERRAYILQQLRNAEEALGNDKSYGRVRIVVDVDPY